MEAVTYTGERASAQAPSDPDVATTIAGLIQEGFGDRVLISHDAGVRTRLTSYGSWGYAHILRHVVPLLRERGLDESDIDLLLVRNPGAVLTVEAH